VLLAMTVGSAGGALVATFTALCISLAGFGPSERGAANDCDVELNGRSRPHLIQNRSPATDLLPQFPQYMIDSLL
jgi:hypothetical protein